MLESNNPDHGFRGTVRLQVDERQTALWWDCAMACLIDTFKITEEQARDYLDSTRGQHLADHLQLQSQGNRRTQLFRLLAQSNWRKDVQRSCSVVPSHLVALVRAARNFHDQPGDKARQADLALALEKFRRVT
jgi:hypothetical protein